MGLNAAFKQQYKHCFVNGSGRCTAGAGRGYANGSYGSVSAIKLWLQSARMCQWQQHTAAT
ncbi:hypothetical protein AFA_09650 [Alcaligenes faecalis]|uniref:Uncharacterized protein n=1 Tax=Alcaligenes faecalis TaxID=511 RepID=A0AB33CT33_ALCFA|nr:hypothetical protein AFA_09650 [Alcaligenes faecalis]